jgi:hypothetical protein
MKRNAASGLFTKPSRNIPAAGKINVDDPLENNDD